MNKHIEILTEPVTESINPLPEAQQIVLNFLINTQQVPLAERLTKTPCIIIRSEKAYNNWLDSVVLFGLSVLTIKDVQNNPNRTSKKLTPPPQENEDAIYHLLEISNIEQVGTIRDGKCFGYNPDARIYSIYQKQAEQVTKASGNLGILHPDLKSTPNGNYSFNDCVLIFFSHPLRNQLNKENISIPQPEGFILIQKVIPII